MTTTNSPPQKNRSSRPRPHSRPAGLEESCQGRATLLPLPFDPVTTGARQTLDIQTARLSHPHLQTAQRQALAAQLGRVRGNRVLQRAVSGIGQATGVIQREDGEEEAEETSAPSSFSSGRFGSAPSLVPELHLDPAIQAQMRALEFMMQQLDPTNVRSALLELDPSALTLPSPALTTSPAGEEAPLVPAGAGPETPRAGSGGDILRAIMRVPLIDSAISALQTQATDQVRRDWDRLSTGERIAAVSAAVLVGGGALAGVISDPGARQLALDQLNGRVLPVPGVRGLSVELNTSGRNVMVGLHLDVGALLPAWMGFGPSSPTPIGGPPTPAPSPQER